MARPIVPSALMFYAALTLLAGCGETTPPPPAGAAAEIGATPPALWTIDVLGDDGAPAATMSICADENLQAGFSRPEPEVNGRACVRVDEAVETDGTYAVRCRIDEQLYRVGSSITGDRGSDFTVEMAVTRQDKAGPSFEQTRRYRKLGPCPAGWENGDSAPSADAAAVNTLTGATRALVPAQE